MDLCRLLLCLLPASRLKNLLLSLTPQWRVDRSAHIGPVLLWRVERAEIGPRARIGALNAFRELHCLRLGDDADIGQLNWFTAAARFIPDIEDDSLRGELRLEPTAGITSRHYLDVSGGFQIGAHSVLGGVRSTVLSHSIDIRTSRQTIEPIRIGEQSIIFTNVLLTPGAVVGDQILVASYSVVIGEVGEPESLYAGAPAKKVASMPGAEVFRRSDLRLISREDEARLLAETKAAERGR